MKLSIWEQIQRMRKEYPTFEVMRQQHWLAVWKGQLTPLCQPYTVLVKLHRNKANCSRTLPEVTVLDPLLRRRSEDPSDLIPHHYPNQNNPELPILCLYDPKTKEWHSGCSVAQTIIPWTVEWLACYEGWLATGEWTGGGRHG